MAQTPRKPAAAPALRPVPPRQSRAEAAAESPAFPIAPPVGLLSYAELAGLGQGGLEAASRANAALTEGWEALASVAMGGARTAFQSATEAARGFLGAKTLEDVVRLQSELARRNLDGFFAGAAKLSAIGWALTGAALLPAPRVAATRAAPPRPGKPAR
jgi:hypothetical protein